jgi:DNA processing protein
MAHDIRHTLLHLSLIPHVGPATIEKIVQHISLAHIAQLYSYSVQDLIYNLKVSQISATHIYTGLRNGLLLETELRLLERSGVNWITFYDPEYPELLKQSHLPPVILYYQGQALNSYTKSVSLVGSRKADNYGRLIVNQLIPELCAANYTIISGGALGIDTFVHTAACDAQGKTIVVLGSGLLRTYPLANKKLFEKITQEYGTVITSFSLETSPRPENFPARNRIIAGLSQACIVIQAGLPSGALITAQYALDQGKEVGAVPGPINNPLSAGCHKLIADGAAVVTSATDIKMLMGEIIPLSRANKVDKLLARNRHASLKTCVEPAVPLQTAKQIVEHDPAEKNILSFLQTPLSFDELLMHVIMAQDVLEKVLWDMQIKGLITQNFMGLWQII